MAVEPTAPRGRQRALTTDDLLELEELGEVALSPDGRWLAYVVKRPRLTATFLKYDFLAGGDRGDVWLVETSGGVPRNLTEGAADGSGYWAPNWSPDSRRLAMLSRRAGTSSSGDATYPRETSPGCASARWTSTRLAHRTSG